MLSQKIPTLLQVSPIKVLLGLLAIFFLWSFAGAFLFGQAKFVPNWPMPPDILLAKPSCELLEYEAAEVLNAKTGDTEQVTRWIVMPFATYADHRPRWTLPEEPLPTGDSKHIGSIANVATAHEAIDTCQAWIRAVKERAKSLKQQTKKENKE